MITSWFSGASQSGALLLLVAVLLVPINARATPFIYAATHNGVSVVNADTNKTVDTISLEGGPVDAALAPDGARLYLANWNADTVSIMDTNAKKTIATVSVEEGPRRLAVGPDGTRVYVLHQGLELVSVIDAASRKVIERILVKSDPETAVVSPDGEHVYVTNAGSGNVSVIDTKTNMQTAVVPVGDRPWGAAVSPDGARLYVSNSNSDDVSIIDTKTNEVMDTVPVKAGPAGLAVTYNGLYVTNYRDASVSVIDVETNRPVRTVRVGGEPIDVTISPDGGYAYVATGDGRLVVIDTVNNSVVDRVSLQVKSIYGMGASPIREPPRLYVDRGACPYEYCAYDEWCTVEGAVALAAPTEGGPLTGIFRKGSTVEAVTGKVLSKPGKLTVIKPHGSYEPGDVLWLYTYLGESVSKVWFEGEMYEEQLSLVRSKSGQTTDAEVEQCMQSDHCWGRSDQPRESTWWVAIRSDGDWGGWTKQPENFSRIALMDKACGK